MTQQSSQQKTPHSVELPRFRAFYLHPKFWPTWLGIGFMYLLSWLPFRLQLALGRLIGRMFYRLFPKRVKVARRNLELCFPDMPAAEREQLIRENFKNTGIALLETGMAWWWPDWRMRRKLKVEGWEHIEAAEKEGKGVFLLLFHFLCLEVHARVFGLIRPSVGLYRPHNNPLMEYLQTRGRSRSNKYMLRKKDVRGMIAALDQGEVCGYLPDQDYGRNRAVYVPLFEVPDAATTTGTSLFANSANCITLISTCERLPGTQGYVLRILPTMADIPSGSEEEDARRVNLEVERAVKADPEMYMWMHRRFKTRPTDDLPSYYDSKKTSA